MTVLVLTLRIINYQKSKIKVYLVEIYKIILPIISTPEKLFWVCFKHQDIFTYTFNTGARGYEWYKTLEGNESLDRHCNLWNLVCQNKCIWGKHDLLKIYLLFKDRHFKTKVRRKKSEANALLLAISLEHFSDDFYKVNKLFARSKCQSRVWFRITL